MSTSNGQPGTVKTESEEPTEDYQKLIDYGIDEQVAKELDAIYKEQILSHSDLDARALDALKEFHSEGGVAVLKEFRESNLEHVSNKSAYLCGVMKTYRQKNKVQGAGPDGAGRKAGPDEAKLKEILDRTGYSLDVTVGQRKYGGPPPGEESVQPGAGHEVFCGKIPKEVFEDELIPLFEKCGRIWDLRLMMDPMTGLNRGYCFITFTNKDGAQEAVKQLDSFEIRPNKRLKVNVSVANLRLFVGNIPKSKSRDEIKEEFSKITENLSDVIIYSSPDDPKRRNRGFAFLEYATHKDASVAKRRIGNGRTRVWNCDIIVDWADPLEEPDEETMAKVKVLYVRKLKAEVTEEQLREKFEPYGKIERIKKIKDYGFVHYENREDAVKAMDELNGVMIGESTIDVSLAKPPSDSRQKQKQKRQQQMSMFNRYDDNWGFGGGGPMGPSPRRPRGGRHGWDMYDDFYGFGGGDFYGNYGTEFFEFDDYSGGMGGGYRNRGGGGGGRMMAQYPPMRGGRGLGLGRGRGGVGGRGVGRGVRGGGGMGGRGAVGRGGGRGMRGGGGRGGMAAASLSGNGGGAAAAAASAAAAGKRKMDQPTVGQSKKRLVTSQDSWGAQPIAQQPLSSEQEWYEDSFASTWG